LISRRNKVLDSKGICLFAHKMYQSFCRHKKKRKKKQGIRRRRRSEEVGPARLVIMMMFINTKEL